MNMQNQCNDGTLLEGKSTPPFYSHSVMLGITMISKRLMSFMTEDYVFHTVAGEGLVGNTIPKGTKQFEIALNWFGRIFPDAAWVICPLCVRWSLWVNQRFSYANPDGSIRSSHGRCVYSERWKNQRKMQHHQNRPLLAPTSPRHIAAPFVLWLGESRLWLCGTTGCRCAAKGEKHPSKSTQAKIRYDQSTINAEDKTLEVMVKNTPQRIG